MQNTKSPTIQNLEAAFAGESMAHIKYMWFARQCRKVGDEATARVFEDTAAQEMLHAFGHAELLFSDETMTPAKCLQYAIDGETHEYTEMYPKFRHEAMIEGNTAAVTEMDEQIADRRNMPRCSGACWKRPPSASPRWPGWKRSTRSTTRRKKDAIAA